MSAPHLTLAIETSNPSAATPRAGPGVALGRVGPGGCECLGVEPLRSEGRHDDDLMPAIARLFERTGTARRSIDRVAVSVGPGGYTGLRVAVAAGKLIAEASGARCVAVPSACVVARGAAGGVPVPFGVALASKGATAAVTVFESPQQTDVDARVVDADGLAALAIRALIADRFLPDAIREACVRRGVPISAPLFDARACLEVSAGVAAVDPVELTPLYAREPEAVRKWRELHPPGG